MTNTELFEAVENNDLKQIKKLIRQGADVNAKDKYGWTPLIWAAMEGHTEIASLLITAGADVNATNKDGYTALMLTASGGSADIVRLLIKAGADVNTKDNYGKTVLVWATPSDSGSKNQQNIIKILKKAGGK